MKIGLVRHFEVDLPMKKRLSSSEFDELVKLYDLSKIRLGKSTISRVKEWDKCYCSDLPRAVETAKHIFQGDIYITVLLREVPLVSIINTNFKLSYVFWLTFGRLGWLFAHKSQPESKSETETRVDKFISEIETQGNLNILIVSHGFIMRLIKDKLRKRGFKGEGFTRAEHGKLYVFERNP
ncbi:MAG: hypothetical protein JM58_12795 [Peptococcaceae bacterium BICA1-8]|nr:MAG: hypothetical protein JM58_12795 [Peptococcaceae bacterium BICA1-8]